MKIKTENWRDGIAALTTVLVMCSIMVVISVIGAIISVSLLNSTLSERLSAEALVAARAGAEDAIIRVIRFKGCPALCPVTYPLIVGNNSASVTISGPVAAIMTIDSTGTARNRKKKIEVKAALDSTTGEFKIQSYQEIAI